jgi:cytochrome bd-type quinol oxidase subunit 2
MDETPARRRRHWADIVVIVVGLLLVGLAAWNAPVSSGMRPDEAESLPAVYAAYAIAGGLALASLFIAQRSSAAGKVVLLVAALVLIGYGVAGYRPSEALWLTVLLPGLALLGALPFFGRMPRARP